MDPSRTYTILVRTSQNSSKPCGLKDQDGLIFILVKIECSVERLVQGN